MGGSPFHAGHSVYEIERRPKIRDVLVARLGADKHVPDLIIHDLLRDALADSIEHGWQEDHVREAHPDDQDCQDHARPAPPLERPQGEEERDLQFFLSHGNEPFPLFFGRYQYR